MIAEDICVGDFIRDLGKVVNVRYFASPVAADSKSNDDDPYYKVVSNEIIGCYNYVVDRVLVETVDKQRCYFANDDVAVIVLPKVLRAAA